ncbi:MAG: LamG-like jellyroll fold domain-containing protein, partial [Acidobacteriota bacterium]
VRQGDWKYVDEGGVDHLFDLGADPREMTNLAVSDPVRVDAMRDHYFDWRAGSDIATDPPTLHGDVLFLDPQDETILDFGPNGGYAELGEVIYDGQSTVDSRLDFHDGDFSFATRVELDALGAKAVIARKEDSWRLLVAKDGTLRLIVVGGPTDDTSLEGPATLDAPAPFPAGQEVHVAFTVTAYRKDAQVIRLFVDGVEVARSTSDIADVGPSDALIRLGNNGSSTAPWLGTIERPRLSVNALYPCEVEADFQETMASAVCSAP